MDYQAALLNPIYATLGVPCALAIGSADYTVRALDKTAGVAVNVGNGEVDTVVPAAFVRVRELAALGVDIADVDDAMVTLNGATWVVESHRMKPSPKGEADGEVYLFLKKKKS